MTIFALRKAVFFMLIQFGWIIKKAVDYLLFFFPLLRAIDQQVKGKEPTSGRGKAAVAARRRYLNVNILADHTGPAAIKNQ
jgi:hypothetical protein